MKVRKTKQSVISVCGICGHESKDGAALSAHLRREHKINTDEKRLDYIIKYDLNNNYYCESGDGSLKEFKRSILSNLHFEDKCYKLSKDKYSFVKKVAGRFDKFRVLADYLFLELKLDKTNITKEIINEHKSKFSATSIEYFLKKTNGNLEEAKKLQHDRQSTTSEIKFIEKYGEEDGIKNFNNHFENIHSKVKGQSYNSLKSYIEQYGEKEGTDKFKEVREVSAHTLENFIRRDGINIGTKKYNSWKKSTARILENFQKTYGIEEGERRYKSYRSNFGNRFGEASKESLLVFNPIMEYIKLLDLEEELYMGIENKKEYFLYDKKEDNFYLYDFTLRNHKLIIEYNGVVFHPNKNKLTESEWENWIEPYSKVNAATKYNYDQTKIKYAEKHGFKVLEIWSDVSAEENIKIVKDFLYNNIKL